MENGNSVCNTLNRNKQDQNNNKKKKNQVEREKENLEFKELALDKAQDEAGFPGAHVAEQNLITRS